ncbi:MULTISPECIES: hypothetical protein [Enterobacterales]|uniref:hypothetical protein n=1 Tax=Enterobacterales TaxID=91347 RepID=UPI002EDA6D4E
MKNKAIFNFIFMVLFVYSKFSLSGSPGGIVLYVHPMITGMVFKNDIDRFFYAHYGVDSEPDRET